MIMPPTPSLGGFSTRIFSTILGRGGGGGGGGDNPYKLLQRQPLMSLAVRKMQQRGS